MCLRGTALLLMLAAGPASAQPAAPPAAPASAVPPPSASPSAATPVATFAPAGGKRILLPPPVQWDNVMLSARPALRQTATDFVNRTGGLGFGMSPTRVNAWLPQPYAGLSWNALSLANEYQGDVRSFGVPIDAAGTLRAGLTACVGAASYVVFLFDSHGLFRLSYRLLADKACGDTDDAARQLLARYVPLGQGVALSLRYRTGKTDVVDITDPTAGYLVPVRWRQGAS